MITNLEIKNFRGFEQTKLENLKHINIVVGANGSGKTALFEAIYLALGVNPAKYFNFRRWRGLGEWGGHISDLWSDLFFNSNSKEPITIEYSGSNPHNRTLEILYDVEAPIIIPNNEQLSSLANTPPLIFKWKKDGVEQTTHCSITNNGISLTGSRDPHASSFFTSLPMLEPVVVSQQFSQLSINGKVKSVIESMKRIFPMIQDLSVENPTGIPMVWANLENVEGKRPLGLVSTGINKILGILLAVFIQTNGVVIIDEIENGLYYKTMPKIWEELYQFSKENNTQLFISSHNLEALQSLLPILKKNENDFSLIRTKFQAGKCSTMSFTGEHLLAALEEEIDIR
jgi:AAA15 family ATPase/GTPase